MGSSREFSHSNMNPTVPEGSAAPASTAAEEPGVGALPQATQSMPGATPPPKSGQIKPAKRGRRRTYVALAVLLVGSLIGVIRWKMWDSETKARFERAAEKARAVGWAVRFEDYDFPDVAPEDNAAPLLTAAARALPGPNYFNSLGINFRPDFFDKPLNVQVLDLQKARTAAQDIDRWMPAIHAASLKPHNVVRVDLSGQDWITPWQAAYLPWGHCLNTAMSDVLVRLRLGDYSKAYSSLATALRLLRMHAYTLQGSHPFTGHLLLVELEQLLAVSPPDAVMREELDALLKALGESLTQRPGLQLWSLIELSALEQQKIEQFRRYLPASTQIQRISSEITIWVDSTTPMRPAATATRAALLERYLAMAELVDKPGREATQQLDALMAAPMGQGDEFSFLKSIQQYKAFSKIRETGLILPQRIVCARLGLRAMAYKEQHGTWPASLNLLVDDDFPEIPGDLYHGEPLEIIESERGITIRPTNISVYENAYPKMLNTPRYTAEFRILTPP